MALLPLVDCRVRLRDVYADVQPRCHSNGLPYGVAAVRTVRLLVKYTVSECAELTRRFGEMIGSTEIDLISALWKQSREAYERCRALRHDVLEHFQTREV